MDYTKAKQLLVQKCSHSNYYYNGYGGRGTVVCTLLVEEIKKLINENIIPDIQFIEQFANYIYYGASTAKSLHSYYKSCVRVTPAPVLEALNLLLTKTIPSIETMRIIAKEGNLNALETIINFHAYKFSHDAADNILGSVTTSEQIHALIINNIDEIDKQKFASYICLNGLYNYIQLYVDKYNVDVTDNMMAGICGFLPLSKNALTYCLSRGLKYSTQCLEHASRTGDKESIKEIMDQRIIPTQKAFRNVITNKHASKTIVIRMMYYYGYVPVYDDVVFAINYRYELPDLDKYNIKLDVKVLEQCYSVGFHPTHYDFQGITPSMQILQTNCSSQNINEVKKLIKKHSLVPDKICMESGCTTKQNKPFVTYLVESGGKMTVNCIKKCAYYLSSNGTLMYIIDEFIKVYEDETKTYENKIENLEKEIKTLKERLNNSNNNVTANQNNVNTDLIESINELNVDNENNEEIGDKVETIEDADNEVDKEDKEDKVGKVEQVVLKEKEKTKDAEEFFIKHGTNLITFPDEIKVPKTPRKKLSPPHRLVKYFGIDKSTKMSYIDARKFIRDKIKSSKWILDEDKTLIDLPKGFRKALEISEDGYISHNDIDYIVSLCYVPK